MKLPFTLLEIFAVGGLSKVVLQHATANSPLNNVNQTLHANMTHTIATTNLGLTDSCIKQKILTDYLRFHEFKNTGMASCGKKLSGLYRFVENAGNKRFDYCSALHHNSAPKYGTYW